jgi:hypothetical protein
VYCQNVFNVPSLTCHLNFPQTHRYKMCLWVSLSWLTTGKCGVQSNASGTVVTSFALAALSWLVCSTDVPIIVSCTRGQVNNCCTVSVTGVFGKHWFTGCTSWNHYPYRWGQALCSFKMSGTTCPVCIICSQNTIFSYTTAKPQNSHIIQMFAC